MISPVLLARLRGSLAFVPMLVGALGCTVLPESESDAPAAPLTCSSDTECSNGHCLLPFGVCSQNQGELTHLLFEITPPASDPVYGGARYLQIVDLDTEDLAGTPERGIEPGWIELNVRPRVPVSGSVSAPPDQSDCVSGGRTTLPVTLTFTPRERLYGLPLPSYDLATGIDPVTREYTFHGSLPPGAYDVYMRPDSAALSESCIAIPQIFHNREIGTTFSPTFSPIEQEPPKPLQLTIPGDENDGWMVDMVHPVTGEVISNRVRLSDANRDPVTNTQRAQLYYSRDGADFSADGKELVRLTPPPDVAAGTVLLERSGLVFATSGEGRIGDVFKFSELVSFQSWVWKKNVPDVPVPATVNFAARDLDDVADGVFTSFDRSATVDPLGQVRVSLLPGKYRVRVTPPSGTIQNNLGQLSSVESTVTVWPNDNENAAVQGGGVILVSDAASLTGHVLMDAGGEPLSNVEVSASASSSEQDLCPVATGGQSAPSCAMRTAVLSKALALDPFVPRTRTALSAADGGFTIQGLDCRECEPGVGVWLDLSVRPPPEMRLPWLIQRSYFLSGDQSILRPLRVPRPVAHALRLTYGDPTPLGSDPQNGGAVPALAGALVRVYAFLDDQSQVVKEADQTVPCVAGTGSSGRCVQSVLQVAELRSGNDGEFLLLLPPNLN